MAQIQANTLHDDVKHLVIAQQFADDYLLIADNNSYEFYSELRQKAQDTESVSQLADDLRSEWEYLMEQVSDLVTREISPIASDFIMQMLNYNGIQPFDLIARELKGRN